MKIFLLLALSASTTLAQTNYGFISFTNKTGHYIERAEVYRVDAERAYFRLTVGSGGGSVLLAELPDKLQTQLGFGLTASKTEHTRMAAAFNNTNSVELKVSNAPQRFEPIWKPNEDQLACGKIFFSTTINEFDHIVTHRLYNPEGDQSTMIVRKFKPGNAEASTYKFITLNYSKRRQLAFDPNKPLEFMVDGARFSFNDPNTLVLKPDYDLQLKEYYQSYHCNVTEEFIRTLGQAQRASMRVPTLTSSTDHTFTAIELRRFHLFEKNFLPDALAIK